MFFWYSVRGALVKFIYRWEPKRQHKQFFITIINPKGTCNQTFDKNTKRLTSTPANFHVGNKNLYTKSSTLFDDTKQGFSY
jgi:formylmethanofuran dehydrogenase subunit A